jgi:predicted transcriptional regulator YheO
MIQKRKFESILVSKEEEQTIELRKTLSQELGENYLAYQEEKHKKISAKLTGTPLPALDNYPVEVNPDGQLNLNKNKFFSVMKHLEEADNFKAANDLIYLGQSNGIARNMTPQESDIYSKFINKFHAEELNDIDKYKDRYFEIYKKIVDGIGDTFAALDAEVVLHDVRDPLHSVCEVRNSISGRHIDDPTTNFGLQLIKEYSKVAMPGRNYTKYCLTLKDGRRVKSTTIPLYDSENGLVGFICINIDLTTWATKKRTRKVNIKLKEFCKTTHHDNISEVIDTGHLIANQDHTTSA